MFLTNNGVWNLRSSFKVQFSEFCSETEKFKVSSYENDFLVLQGSWSCMVGRKDVYLKFFDNSLPIGWEKVIWQSLFPSS